jgi:hypothetical protein
MTGRSPRPGWTKPLAVAALLALSRSTAASEPASVDGREAVRVYSDFELSPGPSACWVFGLRGLFACGILLAAVKAVVFERRRRSVQSPSKGFRHVEGHVVEETPRGSSPVIVVEQSSEGGTTRSGRPFMLKPRSGAPIRIEPGVAFSLLVPVTGMPLVPAPMADDRRRRLTIDPGDLVEVFGPASASGPGHSPKIGPGPVVVARDIKLGDYFDDRCAGYLKAVAVLLAGFVLTEAVAFWRYDALEGWGTPRVATVVESKSGEAHVRGGRLTTHSGTLVLDGRERTVLADVYEGEHVQVFSAPLSSWTWALGDGPVVGVIAIATSALIALTAGFMARSAVDRGKYGTVVSMRLFLAPGREP